MPRDLDLLPEKELFEKTKSIVEYVRDCRISLQYKRGSNWAKKTDKNRYQINIATPTIEHIPKYTAILHELGHILYQSPFSEVDKLIDNWQYPDLFFNVYNLLEDQRIESHLTKEYLAYRKRFNQCLRGLGTELPTKKYDEKEMSTNPLQILYAVRTFREEIVQDCRYYPRLEQAMRDVEGTDKYGALRVLVSIKDIIDDYIKERLEMKERCTRGSGREAYQAENAQQIARITNDETHESREARHERNKHSTVEETEMENIPKDIIEAITEYADKNGLSKETKDEMLNEGKELGEVEYEDIQEMILEKAPTTDNTPSNVKRILRSKTEVEPNFEVSNRLNKIFKHLQMALKPFVDYQGYDIEMDSFVDNLIKKHDIGRSFTNMKDTKGGSVVISIDGSASMKSYDRIVTARTLVSTLYNAIKNIPNITLRGNIWGSDGMGDVGITDIDKQSDVEMITVDRQYNGTPTHMAIEYSARMLKEMKGKKKLLIIVTDGAPNYWKNNVKIPRVHYLKTCRKSYLKAKRITPNIVFVVVHPRLYVHEIMRDTFGEKNIISVPNAELGSEKVIRQFKDIVMSTLV